MKKTYISLLVVLALSLAVFGTASSAVAFPTKTKSCSGCHPSKAQVKITLKRLSSTKTTAKYRVTVSGGSGTAGWAVLSGSKNLAHKTASTGTFTVVRGKTVRVWAVKTGTGSRSVSLVVAK